MDPEGKRIWVRNQKDLTNLLLDLNGGSPVSVDRLPVAVSGDAEWQVFESSDPRRGHTVLALSKGDAGRPWLEYAGDDRYGPVATCFSPDSRYLAFGNQSGAITVIDVRALPAAIAVFESGQQLHD
jgi:hypothetical protein